MQTTHCQTPCTLQWLKQKRESSRVSVKTTLPFTSSMLKSSGKIWGWAFTSKFRLSQLVCSREEPATVPTASKIFWVTSYNISRQCGIRWKLSSLGQSSKVLFIWNVLNKIKLSRENSFEKSTVTTVTSCIFNKILLETFCASCLLYLSLPYLPGLSQNVWMNIHTF